MNTQISSKLAALVVALMINGLIMGGVAYLFDASNVRAGNDSAWVGGPVSDARHHAV